MSSWKLFDDMIINAVRDKPVLYSSRLKEFRNTKIKENAWKHVSRLVEAAKCLWPKNDAFLHVFCDDGKESEKAATSVSYSFQYTKNFSITKVYYYVIRTHIRTWHTSIFTLLTWNFMYTSILVLLRCHLFQGRSVSVGVSVKKSVVGLGVYTRAPSAIVRFPLRIVWRCGPSGWVVCVHGVYGRAWEVVKWSESARASHVMWNAFVNNETLSQLDIHSTQNTHISLPQAP